MKVSDVGLDCVTGTLKQFKNELKFIYSQQIFPKQLYVKNQNQKAKCFFNKTIVRPQLHSDTSK